MEHQMTPEFKQEYDNLAKNYGKIAKDYARRGNVITNLIEILVKNGIMNLDVNDLSSLNKDEVGWLIEKGINIDEGVTVVNG